MKIILLVDDEPDILEFLKYNLIKEGYKIYTALNGTEAIKIAKDIVPDLIILDVLMPEPDGIETCRQLKEIKSLKDTIIFFLSALSEDFTQVTGLETGADDYIVKPIKIKILISKIKAYLRRIGYDSNELTINDLNLNKNNYTVIRKSKEIYLPKKAFELLFLLASKPEKLFTRKEIYNIIWGSDMMPENRTVDVHVRYIRDKLGRDILKTVIGVGYKFN